jgi:hypothetical protein
MRNYFLENKENIRGRVQAGAAMQAQAGAGAAMQAQAGAMQYIEHTSGIYNMTVKTDYKMLLAKFD